MRVDVRKTANVGAVAKRAQNFVSPIGGAVSQDIERDRRESPAYRAEDHRLEPFEQLARIVLLRRAELGISQAELARRMGTTPSVVSRLESGQHATNSGTLKKLAEALGGRALIGFDFGTSEGPARELVAL